MTEPDNRDEVLVPPVARDDDRPRRHDDDDDEIDRDKFNEDRRQTLLAQAEKAVDVQGDNAEAVAKRDAKRKQAAVHRIAAPDVGLQQTQDELRVDQLKQRAERDERRDTARDERNDRENALAKNRKRRGR